jgi:predicted O-linked N-acetylglucosamine transferase (SPINDLY family)
LKAKLMNWHPIAYQHLLDNQYGNVAKFYEKIIEAEPEERSHYWYLGLAYLLDNQEEAAQTTWFFILSQGSDLEISAWTVELSSILEAEADRQVESKNLEVGWLIRQHLREVSPHYLNNLFKLLDLSIKLEVFDPIFISDWDLENLLIDHKNTYKINSDALLYLLQRLLDYPCDEVISFTKSCLFFADDVSKWIGAMLLSAIKIGDVMEKPNYGADLAELCLILNSKDIEILKQISRLSRGAKRFKRAIETSQEYYDLSQTLEDKFLSNNNLLGSLTQAGYWLKIDTVLQRHRDILKQIFLSPPEQLDAEIKQSLIPSPGIFAYQQDNLPENRYFHNQVGKLFEDNKSTYSFLERSILQKKRLKVGYIGHTFRLHSVGWLCRWFFEYYDREKFHTSIYLVNNNLEDEFCREWFASKVDAYQSFEIDSKMIADRIYKDGIDILVDLDSITLNVTYTAMSFKPAPIQVSWLGWDASGLPAIDYFIADPYVLPEDASQFYQEKIWRLPNTYIAVDGFEMSAPTVRREMLNIPSDAIVYLSAQGGIKRHPETIKMQLQILKEVPNSYLLIKGIGDQDAVQELFFEIAQQVGVSPDRLCFRGQDNCEYAHRANLQIADIILDTYPYNGATTTLEALWAGIPLVTRVGNTFSSRNSYGFLKNLDISEGISWTNEEYIKWGIRLGTNETLRQKVVWKLKQSRVTSPLWNTRKFVRDMETAYQEMWGIYCNDS